MWEFFLTKFKLVKFKLNSQKTNYFLSSKDVVVPKKQAGRKFGGADVEENDVSGETSRITTTSNAGKKPSLKIGIVLPRQIFQQRRYQVRNDEKSEKTYLYNYKRSHISFLLIKFHFFHFFVAKKCCFSAFHNRFRNLIFVFLALREVVNFSKCHNLCWLLLSHTNTKFIPPCIFTIPCSKLCIKIGAY